MRRWAISLLVAVGLVCGVAAVSSQAAAAPATVTPISVQQIATGSDNGTTNWYSSDYCTASGGRLDATNYDKVILGTIWQEYHIDADRAGGVGGTPSIGMRQSGTSTWQGLDYWNDFYVNVKNEWLVYDFKVTFANGSRCYIWSL